VAEGGFGSTWRWANWATICGKHLITNNQTCRTRKAQPLNNRISEHGSCIRGKRPLLRDPTEFRAD